MPYLKYIYKYIVDIFQEIQDLSREIVSFKNNQNQHKERLSIIPEPESIVYGEGFFTVPKNIKIYLSEHSEYKKTLQILYHELKNLEIIENKLDAEIVFEKDTLLDINKNEYKIEIHKNIIFVFYTSKDSFYSSAQTIHQILSRGLKNNTDQIPVCTICDHPTHSWRGLLLDVARHYMPIEFLKETIIKMAQIKLNILHLHLTDDQGWRYESTKYPLLQKIGSKRKETVVEKKFFPFMKTYVGDSIPYEGFYTQKELKELVIFAHTYNITIVPEIDIPGHMTALLTAYPEHAAHHAPKSVATLWGVFNNVLSPDEASIEFLKEIFSELCEIFPSKYIHIGGDEVPLRNYKKSSIVKNMVSAGVLKSYKDAPDYILEKIGLHLKSLERIPVMWDEARAIAQKTDGVVMVWHDLETIDEIKKMKIPYICASASHFYFDHYQKPNTNGEPLAIGGYSSLEHVYSAKITKNEYLLGIQANMWTEYTKTPDAVRYMLFPRIYALAEVAWGKYRSNVENFLRKVRDF